MPSIPSVVSQNKEPFVKISKQSRICQTCSQDPNTSDRFIPALSLSLWSWLKCWMLKCWLSASKGTVRPRFLWWEYHTFKFLSSSFETWKTKHLTGFWPVSCYPGVVVTKRRTPAPLVDIPFHHTMRIKQKWDKNENIKQSLSTNRTVGPSHRVFSDRSKVGLWSRNTSPGFWKITSLQCFIGFIWVTTSQLMHFQHVNSRLNK